VRTLTVVMNGVSGRMGYRQHLVRSVLAIRAQGGVQLADGSRVQLQPVLVGRNEAKLRDIAERHGLERWSTDLKSALAGGAGGIYFDAQVTQAREKSVLAAISAGWHVYTEKPIAESLDGALALARAAAEAGVKNGVVHDKLYLPGLVKLNSTDSSHPDSSAASSLSAASSATGSSRATGSPLSDRAGTIAVRMVAGSPPTCSATGTTYWRTSSTPCRR